MSPHPHRARRDRGAVKETVAVGVVVAGLIAGASWFGFDMLRNPIETTTVDHSPPPILTELRDLAEFRAAQAQFEVVIDHEHDVNLIPQFLAGERVQFIAIGTVDVVVDFSGLADDAIEVDADTSAVTITLPAPTVESPVIDHELSHVMNRDRGLFDRLGGALVDNPTSEQALLLAASEKMEASAKRTDLVERAEENTTDMLTGMLGALGYETATILFEESPLPDA